jgi:hypothetical protein
MPGVLVDRTVKSTRPWDAPAVHDPRPFTVQRLLLAELRVAVSRVRLSELARLPAVSKRSTRKVDVEVASAARGLVRNVADVFVEKPGSELVTI